MKNNKLVYLLALGLLLAGCDTDTGEGAEPLASVEPGPAPGAIIVRYLA